MNEVWDNITIHIGMPKCASTSLQCNLFSCCCLPYIGPTGGWFKWGSLEDRYKYLLSISRLEDYRYRRYKNKIMRFLHSYYSQECPGIISDEGITCCYYGGVPEGCNDRYVVAKRYAEIFPGAKILLIIRNQIDFLVSFFCEWNRRFFIDHPNIHEWISECFRMHSSLISNPLCLPDYYGVYEIYSEVFKDKIKIVPLEMLRADPEAVFKDISNYIGFRCSEEILSNANVYLNTRVKVYEKKLEYISIKYPFVRRYIISMVRNRLLNYLKMISPEMRVSFSKNERDMIASIYAQGNRNLMRKTGLPLDILGYPL